MNRASFPKRRLKERDAFVRSAFPFEIMAQLSFSNPTAPAMTNLTLPQLLQREWLETDGLGGYASGTISGERTRRYHAALLAATAPPAGRMVLINGWEAQIETPLGAYALSRQRYAPDVVSPDGAQYLYSFSSEPWPTWIYRLDGGYEVRQELFMVHGRPLSVVSWTLTRAPAGPARLKVRLFFSGRDYHGTHHENALFRFEPQTGGRAGTWTWTPYPGIPAIEVRGQATYTHEPLWYRNFLYEEELARGLDATEDLAAPGIFHFKLIQGARAELTLRAMVGDDTTPTETPDALRALETQRRAQFRWPIDRAADAYLVARGEGRTIIAGYPWFGDWGRDTFIAMRGLCLAQGRLDEARAILLEWSQVVSEGMLPNRFPDAGVTPEYNSVDASLWYIIAVHDYLKTGHATPDDQSRLTQAVEAILTGYQKGTRYGIHLAEDGLIACGVPGVQLTWMDAKVGDWVVTPRIGKPVEIQALWLNALHVAASYTDHWAVWLEKGLSSFRQRFWNEAQGCLYDVVDVDHQPGQCDDTIRPNQIFAVGGLPWPLLEGEHARRVVACVERQLLTPFGLRSLAPGSPAYVAHYGGPPTQRDAAYHQGAVWVWLMGPFVEAWLRVRDSSADARKDARQKFLAPLTNYMSSQGAGHLPEITEAEAPYSARGCPFQAWSLGEFLRMEASLGEA